MIKLVEAWKKYRNNMKNDCYENLVASFPDFLREQETDINSHIGKCNVVSYDRGYGDGQKAKEAELNKTHMLRPTYREIHKEAVKILIENGETKLAAESNACIALESLRAYSITPGKEKG